MNNPFLDSNRLHRDEQWKQSLVGQSVPRTPSEEEVAFCTSCRICPIEIGALTVRVAKANKIHNRPVEFSSDDRRSISSIEIDYCFFKVEESDPVSTVLVAIDCQSKMLLAMPLASKGSNLRGQADSLVRFSMVLIYMDQVECVSDAEPTMKSLLASVQLLRQHLG